MSIQKTITLTEKGVNAGPTYNVSYSSDCVEYTSSVNVTLSSISASAVITVPDNTLCIKLTSIGECTNEIVQYIGPATTTTTAGPTTTTTTAAIDYYYYSLQSCCSSSLENAIIAYMRVTSSIQQPVNTQIVGTYTYRTNAGYSCFEVSSSVASQSVSFDVTQWSFPSAELYSTPPFLGYSPELYCSFCNRDFEVIVPSGSCYEYTIKYGSAFDTASFTASYNDCNGNPTTSSSELVMGLLPNPYNYPLSASFCASTTPVFTNLLPTSNAFEIFVNCLDCIQTTTTTIAPTTTTTTLATTTTTTTVEPTNYVVDIYDVDCNNIDTVVISNSMALVIGKFYGTNELDGPVINVISLTAATPDFFTNITVGPYNTCPDVP